MTRPARKRRAPGALATLATLLALSAALRMAGGPAAAIARDIVADGIDASEPQAACAAEVDAVLTAFEGREAEIDTREAELDERREELTAARAEIEAALAELQAAEAELSQRLAIAETASETDVAQLTDVYTAMKPREAAALFEEMDPNFAAGFIARMRPQAAAAVMAGMQPETAYRLSVILAGRHAGPED